MIVHHCGIDDKRPRGHTSLTCAVDAQIRIGKDEGGIVTATVEHLKDGEAGTSILGRLEVLEVGTDEDGERITSCVLVPTDGDHATRHVRPARPLTDRQANARRVLQDLFADGAGELPPTSNHIPAGRKCLLRSRVIEALEQGGVAAGVAEVKRRREAIGRIVEQLQNRGALGCWQDWIWLAQ